MIEVSNDLINTKYTNKHLKELMTILSGMVHAEQPEHILAVRSKLTYLTLQQTLYSDHE